MKAKIIIDYRSGHAIITAEGVGVGRIVAEYLKSRIKLFFTNK